ncbi:MAG TPA: helix-turn-helix domain-containing protein [Phycisphaerales bacterium]|nr:helix-turn-helix domain-containing protein [Phycisphaerales bacterium]
MPTPPLPALDPYILDSLMPDLCGHDKRPGAFIVYLALWRLSSPDPARGVRIPHARLADATGLSRSTVQHALAHLAKRQLISTRRAPPPAVPLHTVLRPWARRRAIL